MNTKELHFAHQIRQALNERIEHLPSPVEARLASARKLALSRKKRPTGLQFHLIRHAFAGLAEGMFGTSRPLLGRLSVALPLIAGAVMFVGLYEFEREQRLFELAELDVAVLSDDLPITAYADKGFKAFLAAGEE